MDRYNERPSEKPSFDLNHEGQRLVGDWYASLQEVHEAKEPVAYILVMENAVDILRSFDFRFVFPEINSFQTPAREMPENYGISPDVCSYVKADVGLLLKELQRPIGRAPKPDIVVASNMCDPFVRWAEIWKRCLGTQTFVLDLPGQHGARWKVRVSEKKHVSDSRWIEAQLRQLIGFCEAITGKRFSLDRLAEIEENVNEMIRLWVEIMALNQKSPALFNAMLDGLTYVGVMNVCRGTTEGVEYMRRLYADLSLKAARGEGRLSKERFRLVYSGTPCYVSMRGLVEQFEAWNAVFAYSDYLTFAAGGLDAAGVLYDTSRPLESLAEMTALASYRSLSHEFFSRRRLMQKIQEYDADGLIFHGIRSCPFASTAMLDTGDFISKRFGIPALYIESDLIDGRYGPDGRIKDRVDDFFEALQERSRIGAKAVGDEGVSQK